MAIQPVQAVSAGHISVNTMQASSAALQDRLGNRGCYLMLERQSGVAIDRQDDK